MQEAIEIKINIPEMEDEFVEQIETALKSLNRLGFTRSETVKKSDHIYMKFQQFAKAL